MYVCHPLTSTHCKRLTAHFMLPKLQWLSLFTASDLEKLNQIKFLHKTLQFHLLIWPLMVCLGGKIVPIKKILGVKRRNYCKSSDQLVFFYIFFSYSCFIYICNCSSSSHRKHWSWNALSVVPPLILWLCDITLHHQVTRLYKICLAVILACKNLIGQLPSCC